MHLHLIKKTASFPLFIFLFFNSIISSAQSSVNKHACNTFFAEYLSAGTFGSINYDRVFKMGVSFSTSYRVGFSAAQNSIGLPLGIQFFNGRQNSHLEFSLVVIPFVEEYQYLFSAGNRSDKKLYIIPGAGYRYQKPSGGFFLRTAAAPVIYLDPRSDAFWKMDGKLLPGITVAAGYSF